MNILGDFIGPGPTGAVFSDCRRYRYSLWRRWVQECSPSDMVAFVGLNPSTADETVDDPTIRRCIGFAKSWGYSGLVMANLFAFRATKPQAMRAASDPVGPMNDECLQAIALACPTVMCCWGANGGFLGRDEVVIELLRLHGYYIRCLGRTSGGYPRHPLYVRKDAPLKMF